MNQKGGIFIYPRLIDAAWSQSLTYDARYFYFLFYMIYCDHAGFLIYRPKEWMAKLDYTQEKLDAVIKSLLESYRDEGDRLRPSKVILRGKVFWNTNYMLRQGHLKPKSNPALKPAMQSIAKYKDLFPEAFSMIKKSKVGYLYDRFIELKPLESGSNPKEAKEGSTERMYVNFARTFGNTPNPSEIQIYEILIKAGFKDDQIYDAMHKAASAHANMRYAMKVLENKFRKPIDNTTDDFNERMKRRAKEGE